MAASAPTAITTANPGANANPWIDIPKCLREFRDVHAQTQKVRITRLHSNDVVVISHCSDVTFVVQQNQRLAQLIVLDCERVTVHVLDSAVFASRTCRLVNCSNCAFVFEDCDVRKVECIGVVACSIGYYNDPVLTENNMILWRTGCANNRICDVDFSPEHDDVQFVEKVTRDVPSDHASFGLSFFDQIGAFHHVSLTAPEALGRLTRLARSTPPVLPRDPEFNNPNVANVSVNDILEDINTLRQQPPLPPELVQKAMDDERIEYQMPADALAEIVQRVAAAIWAAKHVVVYTGAGISTSANIPDFRGPQGVWTLRDKGVASMGKNFDDAKPTYAHYAVTELVRLHRAHFVISTNMDGLHLRSGLPPHLIAELHGNIYKERCEDCQWEIIRNYDVGEDVRNSREHYTGRYCEFCEGRLQDTIVHFSESYRSDQVELFAAHHARRADLALVLGTSMNVQAAASYPDKCLNNNGQLCIVNLQRTPYDHLATLRVYAYTDVFMRLLMAALGAPEFDQETDTIEGWSDDR